MSDFQNLKVMEKLPDQTWVERLRIGNVIWLVKEKCYGIVEQEYEPPEIGYITDRLGFKKLVVHSERPDFIPSINNPNGYTIFPRADIWAVRADGSGFDFKPLIKPVEGHLADDPPPIDEPIIRQLKRTIASLEHRVNVLEQGLWMANSLSGLTPTTNYPRRKPRP